MNIDTTQIEIFGLPPYFLLNVIGAFFSIIVYLLLLMKRQYYNLAPQMLRVVISFPALFIGAKFVSFVGFAFYKISIGEEVNIDTLLNSGIAFYGGLFGLLLSFYLLGRIKYFKCREAMDALATVVPLFHTFGRCGCFFAGCCFGAQSDSFLSIMYKSPIEGADVMVSRIPIQLIEAGFNLLLFVFMLCLYLKGKKYLCEIYLSIYAVGRFVFEFFRGDAIRGVIFGLSTSQIISILVLIVLLILYLRRKRIGYIRVI